MTKEQKGKLYEEYLADRAHVIDVQIPKGPKLSFPRSWDLKDTITQVTFKTLSKPLSRPKLIVEEVDLMPIASLKYYQITVKR